MKLRYLILSLLLVLALIMAGCTDDKEDDGDDDVIEDDDTGDDEDDDEPDDGNYETLTIKKLLETPYSYSEKSVMVKGAKVISIITYSCTISDDSTTETLTLYGFDEELELKAGDILDVKGIFEQYQNQDWQIKIRKNTDDEVKVTGSETVSYTLLTLDELISTPESYNGLLVEVKGATVTTKYLKGKFNISDDTTTENLLVYIEYGVNEPHIVLNDEIEIKGEFVKFYEDWEIKVRKDSDDNITVIGHTVETYDDVTLATLLGDIDAYNNQLISIANATVGADPKNYKFNISDGSGNSIIVYTDYDAQGGIDTVYEGDHVEVKGQVIYYEKGGYWEIKIRKDSGDKITKLDSGGPTEYTYVETNVATLLNNATNSQYRDKSVKLLNVVVVTKSSRYDYIFGVNDTAGPFNINLTIYGFEAGDLDINDTINVCGLFEWYGDKGYWEIKIRKNTTDEVEKVTT